MYKSLTSAPPSLSFSSWSYSIVSNPSVDVGKYYESKPPIPLGPIGTQQPESTAAAASVPKPRPSTEHKSKPTVNRRQSPAPAAATRFPPAIAAATRLPPGISTATSTATTSISAIKRPNPADSAATPAAATTSLPPASHCRSARIFTDPTIPSGCISGTPRTDVGPGFASEPGNSNIARDPSSQRSTMTLQDRRPTSPKDLADAKQVVVKIKDRIQEAFDENKPCKPIGQAAIDWLLAIPEVTEEVRQTLLPAISQ
ncbi:hypothetical protein BS50DRAFT_588332 [Corynespora cassiicola Philippines]|uniref:Uncharacterized protein n=1 Tax=Corynespora cassiicola Philippines TaxID=1448308 RepID=A0A2T2NPI7_CORCC|nr:hypothetical protein BS50DRAFT_588332 [Corynespora cassiicola Philippines]